MKYLLPFLLLLLLNGCAKDEEQAIAKTGLTITSLGPLDFGGVLLGNYKDAAVRITNHGPSSAYLDFTVPEGPFSIPSKSESCKEGTLSADSFCIIVVRFQPTERGHFDYNYVNKSDILNFKGVGLEGGFITLDYAEWNAGELEAGSIISKRFSLKNEGDTTLPTPFPVLESYMEFGQNSCGEFMTSHTECFFVIEAHVTVKGEHILNLYMNELLSIDLAYKVYSAQPDGVILFDEEPVSLSSAGEDFIFQTRPITDQFGNIVEDHNLVYLSNSSNIILVSSNNQETIDGVVSFTIKTITKKGEGSVAVSSGNASGYSNFIITAGQAFGEIELSNVSTELPSNGTSQIILETELIKDQYNNIVENGTAVIFEVIGEGIISSTTTPKIYRTVTNNGQAYAILKAGTVVAETQVKVYSGEILDHLGGIVGYTANGEVEIHYIPGPADGELPIIPALTSIYGSQTPPAGVTLPVITRVSVGPVSDAFGNIKENATIEISIVNGEGIADGAPQSQFEVLSDEQGFGYFSVVGIEERGNIEINARSEFSLGRYDLWASLKSTLIHSSVNNDISLDFRYNNSREFPSPDSGWSKLYDTSNLEFFDNLFMGNIKYSGDMQTVIGEHNYLPYFKYSCMVSMDDFVAFPFCTIGHTDPIKDGMNSSFIKYTKNNEVITDSLAMQGGTEIVPNGEFSAAERLDNWTINTGAAWDSSYNGSIKISNSVISTKKYASTDWLPVEPNKKYLIKFTIVAMSGSNIDSYRGEMGTILGDIENYQQSWYEEEAPRILRNNMGTEYIFQEQRVVLTTEDDDEILKLYFSTDGVGDGAVIWYDHISMKEIVSENVHDLQVEESPMLVNIGDNIIILGGGNLLADPANDDYSGFTSDRVSVITDINDSSVGLSSYEYLGPKPSGRSYGAVSRQGPTPYIFGGYSNESDSGDALGQVWVHDGVWKVLPIAADPDLGDEDNKPKPRYQNSILLVEELNKLFIIGGLVKDEEEVWHAKDEIWTVDLNVLPLKWKLECEECGLFESNPYTVISAFQSPLMNYPEQTHLYYSYLDAITSVHPTVSIWNRAHQKFFTIVPQTTVLKILDTSTMTYSAVDGLSGIKSLAGLDDIVYNEKIGRTFGYDRGTKGQENGLIYFWDMDAGEKQYIKITAHLEPSAHTYLKELYISIFGYGQSETERDGYTVTDDGLSVYIYNHYTSSWDLIGDNNIAISEDVQNNPVQILINNQTITDYVDSLGNVSLLVEPKGNPGFSGGEPLMGEDLLNVDIDMYANQLAVGETSTCALKDDTIRCWGNNSSGQLGMGSSVSAIGDVEGELGNALVDIRVYDKSNPANASLLVTSIHSGASHMCAKFNNNTVKCWGNNGAGQLGIGDSTQRGLIFTDMGDNLPFVDLGTRDGTAGSEIVSVIDLALGNNSTCALVNVAAYGTRNRVKCWGYNGQGQLGSSPSGNVGDSIVEMGNNLPYVDMGQFYDESLDQMRQYSVVGITAGNNHYCVELENGIIKCWGNNNYGQLGQGSSGSIYGTTGIDYYFDDLIFLEAGGDSTCIYGEKNSRYVFKCWGRNTEGQLGIGSFSNFGDGTEELVSSVPEIDISESTVTSLSVGATHTCFILDNEYVKCLGSNLRGELGYGYLVDNYGGTGDLMGDAIPTVDLGSLNVNSIITYGHFSCAKSTTGLFKCWGHNSHGQLGTSDTQSRGRGLSPTKGTNLIKLDYLKIDAIY